MNKVTNTLRALVTLLAVVLGLSFTGGMTAIAAPSAPGVAANIQDAGNASGKFTRDGKPFTRPANHTTPTPSSSFAPQANVVPPAPECPAALMSHCKFVPAAYKQDDPNDPTNWGNYDIASRGLSASSPEITTIVIHDTEGSCASAISAFQDPLYYVSAHYLVCKDGSVIQLVQNKNIAWHAGNYYTNMHSIGVEHEGNEITGAADYTPAEMASSAMLVKWLAAKYNVMLDAQHIIGHQNVSAPLNPYISGMHVDPGPYWDWEGYFNLLGAPVPPTLPNSTHVVTIAPRWSLNKQQLTDNNGVALPLQSTSTVPLYTQPDFSSPRLTDPVLGQGSNKIDNRAAVAYYGQRFVYNDYQASLSSVWISIDFDGQKAWFFSPLLVGRNFFFGHEWVATPKAGKTSVPVYGRAYPAASAYPFSFPSNFIQTVAPLSYTIPAGQRVTVYGEQPADYYNSQTVDGSGPFDRTTVRDANSHYVLGTYNGRYVLINANDVDFSI
ncbi:MAG TPA: peptidoglycan recognition family protein [Candidatus Saccharimonas sp.]|nr:peptidoglycan recognition family protein [Candidatus Saccharimonas sp.]